MKEMRLFEVGLKSKSRHTGYEEKANVAASDANEAVAKMRQWVEDKTKHWWEEGGLEDAVLLAYTEDIGAPDDMKEADILATSKYQEQAQKEYAEDMERVTNLRVAKVLDVGTLIV